MVISARSIRAHEWIGLKIVVEKTSDPTLRGLNGQVRDETRNMFTIETTDRIVKVAKLHNTFRTTLATGETIAINGSDLRYRPEDRVKRGLSKW
jgi:RNase P/RNase MRP subunit p29